MVELSPLACRVVGVLLEKERTVPATYPLTPKAVVSGANQTTGRDPIMAITEGDVATAIRELRDAHLARTVHASHGARTEKYRQVLDETLGLDDAERAVITLLLLRGAQTPGELRTRSDRLHAFGSVDEVDTALRSLAERDEPLVRQLERQPGQKEQRWVHLLAAGQADSAVPASAGTSPGTGAATTAPPATAQPERAPELVPALAPLADLVGTWVGAGEGHYPTIDPFSYRETITFSPVPGKALLAYRSATTTPEGTQALHGESGFLRSLGDGSVELVISQGTGLVEIAEGVVDDGEVLVDSTAVVGTSTAKSVEAVTRRYVVEGGTLTYDLSMAAVGQPMTHHLHATLRRS